MTRKSTPSRPGSEAIRRRIFLARLIVAMERIGPLLWPAGGFVALFLLLASLGVLPHLIWPLHALILAIAVTAVALSLARGLQRFAWPSRREAARRLERDSALEHRPFSEAEDALALGKEDALAEALWAAHRKKTPKIGKLRLSGPRIGWGKRDPWHLRYGALFVLALAIALVWQHGSGRLIAALGPAGYVTPGVDAWIDPPAYTGVAPVYLNARQKLTIPAGSKLNIRVHGADRAPFMSLRAIHFPWLPFSSQLLSGNRGEYSADVTLRRTAEIRVRAIGRTIGRWDMQVVPDQPPEIHLTSAPKASQQKTLEFAFAAHDDYGVAHVRAILTPVDGHGAPFSVDLQVPPGKKIEQRIYRDLTSHPYAGLKVRVALEARDGAGHVSRTKSAEVRLPHLIFTDPLAKALVELRQDLAQDGFKARKKVGKTLDALAIAPQYFYAADPTMYQLVRHAFWALSLARHPEDLTRIEDMLWQGAMGREHGGARSLADALRHLERAIAHAMASGASQDDIRQLLARYHRTMQQYLRAMGRTAQTAKKGEKAPPKGKVLGEKDLNDLLKAIQTLSESGDRERAAKLLSFLQNMIENMQMTASGSGGGTGGESPAERKLRDLSDLAGQQRHVMDQTFRAGQQDKGKQKSAPLAASQDKLNKKLQGMLKGWKDAPKSLRQAEKQMRAAGEALKSGDLARANQLQKQALEGLREGAGEMAKKSGRNGGQAAGTDPFGRAGGPGAKGMALPDETAIEKLRSILKELRKKAGENSRPQEERDYIERLLKQF